MATKSTIKKKEPLLDLGKFQDTSKPSLMELMQSPAPVKNKLMDTTPQPSAPSTPEVIRDAETGELTGVVTPSGKRLFGLSPKDVKGLADIYASRMNVPAGTIDSEKVQEQRMKQQVAFENQQLANQVGTPVELPQEEQKRGNLLTAGPLQALMPEVDLGQALGEGAAQAGAGFAVGTAIPVVGNVAGSLLGFVNGVRSSITRQLKEGVSEKSYSLDRAQVNLKTLVRDIKANPQNAASDLEMFNYQLSLIDQEYGKLKRDTQRSVNKFLGADGSPELHKYELFYMPGGSRDFLVQQLQMAILNPNLANVDLLSPEDILEYE